MFDGLGNEININRLYGKTITAIGDSYVAGNNIGEVNTWLYKLANRNNMTYYKLGLNGDTLINIALQSKYTTINQNSNYIIVFAGHNDSSANKDIGQNTDTTANTFKGALNVLCKGLMNNYPKARILFVTPTHRTGNEKSYVDAIKEICGEYGIPVWDAYRNLGILVDNQMGVDMQEEFEQVYVGNYNIHLNVLGNEYLSYKIEEQLKLL